MALVSLGGELRWLTGSPGTRQLYRILDALFSSAVRPSFRWKGVTHLPRRLLPARALVIALTPLLDERGTSALLELRARGYDLAVLEISPLGDARRDDLASVCGGFNATRCARVSRRSAFGRALGAHAHRRRAGDRGGDHVTAPRTARRARLTTAAGAIALAALAAAATARSPAVAAAATLLLSLALLAGRSWPVCLVLVLLGTIYVIPEGDRAIPAPIYAGALLLIAELAYWSLGERAAGRIEPGTATPRLLGILAVVATGVAAATLVLLASDSDVARSPARTAAGVGAILACVAVLGALARSPAAPKPDG